MQSLVIKHIMKKNSKVIQTIGVFDSGLGGLTILNQLKNLLFLTRQKELNTL